MSVTAPGHGLLEPGGRAPRLDLPLAGEGGSRAAIPDPQGTGTTLVVFFREDCPTCRLTLPFVQRLHERVAGRRGARVLGVSQDGDDGARAAAAELGLTFPIAVDGPDYPVSSAWGLVAVPTLYLVGAGGSILRGRAGFDKADLASMAEDLAAAAGVPAPLLYHGDEQVPALKPG